MSQDVERRGGARRGAGRPRKGDELRVTMSFSVDPTTLERARELRGNGCKLNAVVEDAIRDQHRLIFGD